MKKEISQNQFMDEFKSMNRDNYSYEGYQALYDYYDEFEDFDLDVIAICCDVTEYDEDEVISSYDYLVDKEEEFKEEFLNEIVKELENKTHIIKLNNSSFLVWSF